MIGLCVICKGEIIKEGNYFKVELFKDGKLNAIDYAHQICWMNRNNMDSSIKQLVGGALNLLESSGMNKPREKVITI